MDTHYSQGPESISKEELLWYKGHRILNNAVALELRQLFQRLWNQNHPTNPWQDDQTSGEMFYKDYKPKRSNGQCDDIIKNGKLGEWDMTVLCRAFIDYSLMDTIGWKYIDKVKILRDLRNTYAHSPKSSRQQGDYQQDIDQIRQVFTDLGLSEETLNEAESITPETLREELPKRPDQQDPPLPEWFRSMPRDQKQRIVTEKLFGGIAEHIGGDWEMIAVEMDIPKPKREKCVAEHPTSINGQIMAAFIIWKQKHLSPPTIKAFIQILWKCNGRCHIDWEGVEEVVRGDW